MDMASCQCSKDHKFIMDKRLFVKEMFGLSSDETESHPNENSFDRVKVIVFMKPRNVIVLLQLEEILKEAMK